MVDVEKRPLEKYHEEATAIADRSNGLWLIVNGAIVNTLKRAICEGHDHRWVHDILMGALAPQDEVDGPVSLQNFKTAAKTILQGTEELVLI